MRRGKKQAPLNRKEITGPASSSRDLKASHWDLRDLRPATRVGERQEG